MLLTAALLALLPVSVRAQDTAIADEGATDDDAAPPPPIVTLPEAPAATSEPGPFDGFLQDGSHVVALATVAGGLAAGVSIGALTFLSPCCFGCWFGAPIGAAATLFGATIGVGMARSWRCNPFWTPVLVAGLIGGVAGTVAGVVGVVVAQATGSTLSTRTYLPDVATGSALLSATAAGGAACLTMLLGSLIAGGAAMLTYGFQDSHERDRREQRRREQESQAPADDTLAAVAY